MTDTTPRVRVPQPVPKHTRMGSRHLGGATRPTGILPVGKPANKTTQNPRAITVRNNHTPRADHALLHLKYVTYRAKNIRFATTGWAALVAPLGEAALSPLRFDGGRLGGTPRPTAGSDRSVAAKMAALHTAAQERGPPVRSRNGRDAQFRTRMNGRTVRSTGWGGTPIS